MTPPANSSFGFLGAIAAVRDYVSPPILQTVRSLDSQALNERLQVLEQTDSLRDLLQEVAPGSWCLSPGKRLIRLLTVERLGELTVQVRAALVLAMQKGITGRVMEEGITNILTGTKGPGLTRLKGIIDRHSPQDMAELVYHDVDSERLRGMILDHIGREAPGISMQMPIVLSDIDDTVFCNWKDKRYPKKTVYPGMHAFYRALGRLDGNDWERRGPVFDSVRPGEPTGIVEGWTVDTLKGIGFPHPTVLSGDLFHLLGAEIAVGKFKNYVQYHQLFPEFWKVLVGDNGQYDVDFERRVLTVYAETALAGFIHDIGEVPVNRPKAYSDEELKSSAGVRRIFYFDTYIGAALAAFEMQPQLISLIDLHRVVQAALMEFNPIPFASNEQAGRVRGLLQRDTGVVGSRHGLPNDLSRLL